MSPLVHAPSQEAVALARALIREPGEAPGSEDLALRAAVAAVAAGLDEYDLRLIAQVAEEPTSSHQREALELAMAQRIERMRLLGS
jgi:hypothetical protein